MVKNLIRKSLLEQGQLLSKNFTQKADIDIQNAAIKHLDIRSSKNILLYFPYKNEVTLEIISQEFKKYKQRLDHEINLNSYPCGCSNSYSAIVQ